MPNVREEYGDKITYCDRRYDALEGADALAIVTEWQEFRTPRLPSCQRNAQSPSDLRWSQYPYDPAVMKQHGFTYYGIGRLV